MLYNLTDYFKTSGKTDNIFITFSGEDLDVDSGHFLVEEGQGVETTVKNISDGRLEITGQGNIQVKTQCARCLKDVAVPVEIDFDLYATEPDGFHEPDEDEEIFMEGYELNGDSLIHNELIMGLPMKVLCKDDCKGLCPKCGSNRNEGECRSERAHV